MFNFFSKLCKENEQSDEFIAIISPKWLGFNLKLHPET